MTTTISKQYVRPTTVRVASRTDGTIHAGWVPAFRAVIVCVCGEQQVAIEATKAEAKAAVNSQHVHHVNQFNCGE
jgi:hypothetical protein